MRGLASLADISRRAGVSIATASRVLNGSSHPVSEATRSRVLAAADELGYRPSELARALVKRTSRIVGVIVGDIVDPYFAEIARGVEDVAARVGHLTMVCNADRRPAAELAHLDVLRDYHAAGVVFAGSGYEHVAEAAALRAAVAELQEGGAVVVALAVRDLDCPSVLVDNRAAAREATEHLLSLGPPPDRVRRGAGGAAHERAPARRLPGGGGRGRRRAVVLPGGFEFEAGAAAAETLLAGALPDAVLGVNDEVAIGLLTGLRRGGVDVPGRVSVAGIDDTRPARLVDLTSVSLPLHELGEMAARVILEGAEGDIVLPHRLVQRATTGARAYDGWVGTARPACRHPAEARPSSARSASGCRPAAPRPAPTRARG